MSGKDVKEVEGVEKKVEERKEMGGGKMEEKKGGEKVVNGWKEVEVKELDRIFERRAFRAKNWNTAKLKEDLEKLEPGKVYEMTVQEFVKEYGKDGIKSLTLQGQKKKVRQVLRRMMDYFELKVSIEGTIIRIVKLK